MITERTLRKWRAEALAATTGAASLGRHEFVDTLSDRVLRMTQELLDQYLLSKTKSQGQVAAKVKFDTLAPSNASYDQPEEDKETKKTSEEWHLLCYHEVLDPDGWNRSPDKWQFSWFEEKISRKEFDKRLGSSTCRFDPDHMEDMWRDKQ